MTGIKWKRMLAALCCAFIAISGGCANPSTSSGSSVSQESGIPASQETSETQAPSGQFSSIRTQAAAIFSAVIPLDKSRPGIRSAHTAREFASVISSMLYPAVSRTENSRLSGFMFI